MQVLDILTAVGSSGLLYFAHNVYVSRKSTKIQSSTEERNRKREPHVLKNLELRNQETELGIIRSELQVVLDAKMRLAEELAASKSAFEDRIESLQQENDRLREIVLEKLSNNREE